MALLLNAGDTVSRSYSYTQPSPLHPSQPQECGERTGNLVDVMPFSAKWATVFPNLVTFLNKLPAGNYTLSYDIELTQRNNVSDNSSYGIAIIGAITQNSLRWDTAEVGTIRRVSHSFTISTSMAGNIERAYAYGCGINGVGATGEARISNIMLNLGLTALPYENFGYKIPISSASTTTPVYLGEVETTRKIKKLVLTGEETSWATLDRYYTVSADNVKPWFGCVCTHCAYNGIIGGNSNTRLWIKQTSFPDYQTLEDFKAYLAQQYANGTPVTVWYILATEETGIVNEPLMRIGDYSDTLSNVSIPVTAGGDTLSVGTTVQPSEVTVNYKGWHPVADVHERENGAWD